MILGIDASNIRVGGGVTHLVELLRAAEPRDFGFSKVVVWGSRRTLDQIADRPEWLIKKHEPVFEEGILKRALWQSFSLSKRAREEGCSLLFVPGGSFRGNFQPVVSMSQNLLPFEWKELRRYGFSMMTLKMMALRYTQGRTFKRAAGVLFLTEYAKGTVERSIGCKIGKSGVVPLGLHHRFNARPMIEKISSIYTRERPCRLLYVSVVDVYKHQWHVVEAVRLLRDQGYEVKLDLVGPSVEPSGERLEAVIRDVDPSMSFVSYRGRIPHDEIAQCYKDSDINVFASSCENMPNILLEAMASGVPVACSELGPMPEVLRDAGVYFDPENPADICRAIKTLIDDPSMRVRLAKEASGLVGQYSWKRCADETFGFFREILGRSLRMDLVD